MDIILTKVFLLYISSDEGHGLSIFPQASITKRQDTFANRLVEKDNEYSIYLEMTQFPDKIEWFVCLRLNIFLCGRSNVVFHQW